MHRLSMYITFATTYLEPPIVHLLTTSAGPNGTVKFLAEQTSHTDICKQPANGSSHVMAHQAFHCIDPDFVVRSIPDGDAFNVKKDCLIRGSAVFRDMFASCDNDSEFQIVGSGSSWEEENNVVDLYEPATVLDALFQLLHEAPPPFVPPPLVGAQDFTRIQETIPDATIPYPLIPALFALADKYALSEDIVQTLRSHLAAYVSTFPLKVYGCAVGLGLDEIAVEASAHLLHPPLTSYSPDEIKVIPTAEAYHQLVLLHEMRVKKLGQVLLNEDIFPHGYGECTRHAQRTKDVWRQRKTAVISKIQAATDVSAEMAVVRDEMSDCQVCSKACNAAVAMLAYKCAKIPRKIDKVEPDF